MRRVLLAALGLLALAPAGRIQAQAHRAAVELTGGLAIPTGDFSYQTDQDSTRVTGVTNKSGSMLGGNVLYGLTDRFYLVAGFSRAKFSCKGNGGCPSQDGPGGGRNAPVTDAGNFVIQGPQIGADWRVADTEGMGFRFRGLINFDQPKFTKGASFDRAAGFELGFGVDLHVKERFTIAPELRWTRSSSTVAGVAVGGVTADTHPSYATADIALRANL